jgi:flagellar FliL protein
VSAVPETEPKRGPSLVIQIAVLLVLTLMAAGIGWFSGMQLNGGQTAAKPAAGAASADAHGAAPTDGHGEAAGGDGEAAGAAGAAANGRLVHIEPITTNLAVPDTIWIRLELSLLFNEPPTDSDLPIAIQQDILAYIRTVKLAQLQGASGYRHLKSDLLERANIRSKGAVKDVLVRTMIFE